MSATRLSGASDPADRPAFLVLEEGTFYRGRPFAETGTRPLRPFREEVP